MNQIDLFIETLPKKPYCTDILGFLDIRPAMAAIKRRFIQPNSPTDLRWLVYDVDRPTAFYDWEDLHAPAPNIVVRNRENGHAHLLYGLEVPVYKQPSAQRKPLRYAAAIDVALTEKLEADPGYAGFLCKNPLHPSWDVSTVQSSAYTLGWLSEYVDLSPFRDKRIHLPPVGLGRNCTIFDVTRRWAYRQRRSPQGWLSMAFFIDAVTEYASGYNVQNFSQNPLPWSEVKATGKSIGKWTWENMDEAGFRAWGDNRRKASIKVRQAGSFEKAEQVRLYKETHPEATTRAIAEIFEVTAMTVSRYLRG